jgi:hypothetical protein
VVLIDPLVGDLDKVLGDVAFLILGRFKQGSLHGCFAGLAQCEEHRQVPPSWTSPNHKCVRSKSGPPRRAMSKRPHCTLVLIGGTEVSGATLNAALDALEARLADDAPPPMAA